MQYIADRSRDGMSEEQWREATRFDGTDWGWVIMSIGMAIGAGIVFLPVKVGLVGLWVFLASSVIAYPAMYLFQRLFINTLAESPKCEDYPSVISGYLGKNWGFFLGVLYFIMLVIWVFVSHDLGVVRHLCDTVVVMSSGRVIERGPLADVYGDPQHEVTQELLAAIPRIRVDGSTD